MPFTSFRRKSDFEKEQERKAEAAKQKLKEQTEQAIENRFQELLRTHTHLTSPDARFRAIAEVRRAKIPTFQESQVKEELPSFRQAVMDSPPTFHEAQITRGYGF